MALIGFKIVRGTDVEVEEALNNWAKENPAVRVRRTQLACSANAATVIAFVNYEITGEDKN